MSFRIARHLTPEAIRALAYRYEGTVPPIEVTDYAQRFGNMCDAVVQILWADRYRTRPDDPEMHASAPARTLAHLLLRAAGIHKPEDNQDATPFAQIN